VGRIILILGLALSFCGAQAQTFTDNFNDNSFDPAKWGAAVNTGNGRLFEQNTRVDYIVTSATANADAALRPWVGQLPLGMNWEAVLQVHNALNLSGTSNRWGSVGLQLKRPGNTNEVIFVELYAEPNGAATSRGFLTSMETPETLFGDSIAEDLGVTNAFVKIAWDAATGIVTTSYDRDAAGTTYGWQPMASFAVTSAGGGGVGNRDWGLSASQMFTLQISGFSRATAVTTGNIWADNFSLTILPSPPTPTVVNIADNFNDNAVDATKWGTDVVVGNGRLSELNQRLQYRTVLTPTGADESARPWIAQLPIDADWEATVDVHNEVDPADGQWASVGIQLLRPGSTTEKIYLELYAFGTPDGLSAGFYTSLQNDPQFYGDTFSSYDTLDATLKLSYTASNEIVVASFDRDGAATGFGWQPLASFGLGGSGGGLASRDWALSAAQKFRLSLYGYSEFITLSGNLVSLDNFNLAIVQAAAPSLSATREGTNLRITWPASATGYTLQSITNLNLTAWNSLQTPTTPNGANFEVVVPMTGQNQFFRLQKL
jgi:hypothetical protein